jgi:hypothetical protein
MNDSLSIFIDHAHRLGGHLEDSFAFLIRWLFLLDRTVAHDAMGLFQVIDGSIEWMFASPHPVDEDAE